MPSVTLETAPLRLEQKQRICRQITQILAKEIGLPPQTFYIFIKENPLENIAVGGKLLAEHSKNDDNV